MSEFQFKVPCIECKKLTHLNPSSSLTADSVLIYRKQEAAGSSPPVDLGITSLWSSSKPIQVYPDGSLDSLLDSPSSRAAECTALARHPTPAGLRKVLF